MNNRLSLLFASICRILCALVLFVVSASSLSAQERPTVKAIEVQFAGPASMSKERILANMRTTVGKPYNEADVEEDIRNLYATGNVANVRIFGEPAGEGAVTVIVVVQTKATASEIIIQGNSRISEKKIRKTITTKKGDPINESNLEADRQKILTLYQDQNYSDATVTYTVDTENGASVGKITFTIMEGERQVIRSVGFEGNETFSSKILLKQIKTRKHSILSFLSKTGRVQSDVLDQDAQKLREYYQDNGYVDVVVANPKITPTEKGDVDVIFPIKEGSKYSVGTVNVVGAEVFTTDEVRNQIKLTSEGTYSPKVMRDDSKRITDMYGTRGYVDAQVIPETSSARGNIVNVTYRLSEGTQSYLDKVNISGNQKTKDKVIRREMAVSPGDVFNTVLVDASRQRLMQMDYFSRVEMFPKEIGVPGRKDLDVIVEEKPTGSVNFGAGFSSIDSLLGFVEVQQKNFDALHPWNFTGGGQRFRARVQYGTQRRDFIVSLVEPYFMDYKLELGGDLFYRDAQYLTSVYNQSNAGFDIFVRKPLGKFTSIRGEYRLEQIQLKDFEPNASPELKQEEGSYLKSAITGSINYDTRDSIFLTRKGERVDFSLFVSGLGGDVEDYGFNLEGSKYIQLPWDTILILTGELGAVDNFGGGNVPIFDRLFLGGANTLRGFNYRDVGPKDENGEPLGGKTMARATVEYTVPIVERVRGALFYDAGFVNSGAYDFSPSDFNSDIGFGVRLDLPVVGVVRLDYGIPVQADQYNDGGGKFNFNVGWQY